TSRANDRIDFLSPTPGVGNPRRTSMSDPGEPPPAMSARARRRTPAEAEGACLGDRTVACDCDPALHRPVALPAAEIGVAVCLRWATDTATRRVGDDGRYTGAPWDAYYPVPLKDAPHAWLSQWPRARVSLRAPIRWPMAHVLVRYDFVYLPVDCRCESVTELAELESRLGRE